MVGIIARQGLKCSVRITGLRELAKAFEYRVNPVLLRFFQLPSPACPAPGGKFHKEIVIKTFNKKTAFISGGASGIGLGMARAFAEKGMNLALADIDPEKLEAAKKGLAEAGAVVQIYPLDVTDSNAVATAVSAAKQAFGSINVVCANAGVSGRMEPLDQATLEDWNWIIDVNLKGTVHLVQAALPMLMENPEEAHIVITSSISGLRIYKPSRNQGTYNTTKYALVGLAEALHMDLEEYGIGVTVLCPGVVNTDISHSGRKRPEKYGGAIESSEDHELAMAAASGTDPLQFGQWVIRAIEENRLYAITHSEDRELVEQRHRQIMDAFDYSGKLTGS